MQQVSAKVIHGFIALCAMFLVLAPFFVLTLVFMLPMCPKSSCDDYWKRFPYVLMQLLAIPTFFGVVTLVVLFKQAREYFLDHFDEYKCKPWFLPFVSFVRPDVDTADNLKKCLSSSCGSVFAALTTPFLNITESMGNGLNIAQGNFEQVQRNHLNLGNDMLGVFMQSNQHMGKMQAMATYMFIKMKAVFDKLLAMVFDFYFALITMLDMVNIMILMPQYFIAGIFTIFWACFALFTICMILSVIYFGIGFALLFVPFMQAPAFEELGQGALSVFVANAVQLPWMMLSLATWGTLHALDVDAQRASDRLHARNRRRRLREGQ